MYDEISFLFKIGNTQMTSGNPNYDEENIFKYGEEKEKTIVYYKDFSKSGKSTVKGKNKIKNFLNETSYYDGNSDQNPYIKIIEKLSHYNPMSISYADLAYLTDLGVYPVNRLVILRRFAEGVIVPHNLNDIDEKVKPISTIIGWVKPEQEKMFDIGFNENWVTTHDKFWDVISDIIERDTGMEMKNVVPIPGWAQGFLYQFLSEAGLTDNEQQWNKSETPIGDPDVLKESKTREIESQGIESKFSFKLETSYEQKYINNIDPGSAMLDIINNALRMGTSDMKYMLGSEYATKVMNTINSKSDNYAQAWFDQIQDLVNKFINTLEKITGKDEETVNEDENKNENIFDSGIIEIAKNALNAAIYRFRWPMKGSLGVMTGLPTGPWHLTVGNPLNPTLSMGNMIVTDSNISWGNEMGFNDMPTQIDVEFSLSIGRPLGGSDIIKVLNNAYSRYYTPVTEQSLNTTTTSSSVNNVVGKENERNSEAREVLAGTTLYGTTSYGTTNQEPPQPQWPKGGN